MGKITAFFCFIFSLSLASWAVPAKENPSSVTKIKSLRIWPSPDSTRVVFDLSGNVVFEVKQETENRIIIYFKNVKMIPDLTKVNLTNTRIKTLQEKSSNPRDLQLTLELEQPLTQNSFILTPNQQYGHRLVIDLELSEKEVEAIEASERAAILALFENAPILEPAQTQTDSKKIISQGSSPKKRKFVVAIDAGHGGEDPGAIGRRGTKEKEVVLAIAKRLKEKLDKEHSICAVLIRTGDYYVGLKQRVAKARKHKADLFISIHADAFHDKRAEGASVFTLSERGATSTAARWLAERENRSDLVGGVKLKDKNKLVASVLLDMSQTASKAEGLAAANHILNSLSGVGSLHRSIVEKAGFAVLKAPDIPSLLIETGFITHPHTEAKLRTKEHQQKIAHAILLGIRHYVAKRAHLMVER